MNLTSVVVLFLGKADADPSSKWGDQRTYKYRAT